MQEQISSTPMHTPVDGLALLAALLMVLEVSSDLSLATSTGNSTDSLVLAQGDRILTTGSFSRCWIDFFADCADCPPRPSVKKTVRSCTRRILKCSTAATVACGTEEGARSLWHCRNADTWYRTGRRGARDQKACALMKSQCNGLGMPCNACDCGCGDRCCPACRNGKKCCVVVHVCIK